MPQGSKGVDIRVLVQSVPFLKLSEQAGRLWVEGLPLRLCRELSRSPPTLQPLLVSTASSKLKDHFVRSQELWKPYAQNRKYSGTATKAWSILEDSLTYRRALLRHSDLGLRVWGTLRTAELCAMAYER